MDGVSALTAELSASVNDFIYGKGSFKGNRTTKGARKLYRKKRTIPIPFIAWLEDQGVEGVVEVFTNVSRENRTVPALLAHLESRPDVKNKVARILAEGQMLGNLRYRENDRRAGPETILNRMVDRIH